MSWQRRDPEWAPASGATEPLRGTRCQDPTPGGISRHRRQRQIHRWEVGTKLSECKCWEALPVPMTVGVGATVGIQRGCSHIHSLPPPPHPQAAMLCRPGGPSSGRECFLQAKRNQLLAGGETLRARVLVALGSWEPGHHRRVL